MLRTGLRRFAASRQHRRPQPSYSQTGEDRLIRFLFGELRVDRPSYLDLGAYDPFHLSNTALLHGQGSRGINVEPDPLSFASFLKHRPRDVNLNVGVGVEPGTLTFYRMSARTLSTFSEATARQAVEESGGRHQIVDALEIEVLTVPQILDGRGVPDLLSLDVEGLDLDILATMPTWQDRPTVVCVETITYSEHGNGQKLTGIEQELDRQGYMPFADTYINTIFVLRDRWIGH